MMIMNGTILNDNDIFHVHTARCGHAEQIPDEEYVKTALELGKSGIWFTDHAPFPGDPFHGRMKYAELEEYLTTLTELKEKYHGYVHVGLEIEYFPSFDKVGYYKQLSADPRIECLLLGQHMAEDPAKCGHYTFEWAREKLCREEYLALGTSIYDGIHSRYFHSIAHPDRIFRRCKAWTADMQLMSAKIVHAADQFQTPLEWNMHSLAVKNYHWPEFWNLVPSYADVIIGLDAHSKQELLRRNQRAKTIRTTGTMIDDIQWYICDNQKEMFEYAQEHGANILKFAEDFLNSSFCNRSLDKEYSVDQFADIMNWEELMQSDCVITPDAESMYQVPRQAAGWIGFIYRYLQIVTGLSSSAIVSTVPPDKLLHSYPGLHTLDDDVAVEIIMEDFGLCKNNELVLGK